LAIDGTMATQTTEEDPTGVCFKDSRWLELFPLNKDTVLTYFAISGFYDKTCNNEQIRMQRLTMDKMLLMKGLEYKLEHTQEPFLYVIKKQKRESPNVAVPIAIYYIINGTIFQAPHIYSVLAARASVSLLYLQQSFSEVSKFQSFDPYTAFQWNWEKSGKIATNKTTPKTKENQSLKRRDVDKLIASLYNQFAPVSSQANPADTLSKRKPDTPGALTSDQTKKQKRE